MRNSRWLGQLVQRERTCGAFSLVEIFVAIAVIAILISLIIPGARRMTMSSRQAACIFNLKQIGGISQLYSGDNNGNVPPQYDMGTTFSVLLAPYAGGMKGPMIAPDIFYCPENVAQKMPPAGGFRVTSKIFNKGWSGYYLGYLINASVHSVIYLDENELANGATIPSRRAVKRMEIQMPSKTVSLLDLPHWPENGAPPSSGLGRDYYFDPTKPEFALGTPHRDAGNVLFCDGHVETFSDREKMPVASLPDQTETWW